MVLSTAPGGLIRVPFRAALPGGRLVGLPVGSARAAQAGFLALIGLDRGRLLLRAEPPREGEEGAQGAQGDAEPQPTTPRSSEPPPPLPVVVVHRRPEGSAPDAPPRGRGRRTLGDDLMGGSSAPRALRKAISQLVGSIAEKRDDERDEERS